MPQTEIMTSVRAALETTRGTGVNPTRVLEFTSFGHEPSVGLVRPYEQRASYFGRYRASAGREKHKVTLSGQLTYNQLAWLGNLFFKKVTTGTGAGADKTYAFPPSSATDDLASATLEWGYDSTLSAGNPGWRLPYVVGDDLVLVFDKTDLEGVKFTAQLHSPVAATQITAFGGTPTSLASTAISPIQTSVYIDAATIGTTLDTSVQRATFHVMHPWTDLDTLNGTTAAQATFRAQERTAEVELFRYLNNDNELDRYHDKAIRKIRIKSTGPTLGSTNYSGTIDFYGAMPEDGWRVGEVDGLKFETLKYVGVYDTTAATDHRLDVVTAETSIT